jgi:hypothetical protein
MNDSRKVKIVECTLLVVVIGIAGIILAGREKDSAKESENILGRRDIATVPYVVNIPPAIGYEGDQYIYDVKLSDSDTMEENLSISLVDSPNWLFVEGKRIYGVPPVGSAGQYRLKVRVSDGENSSVRENYILIQKHETN